MNRAMFAGVSGLKSHQTRMDVIGNNIANVNTYGYKSQRAVFSDIFYQTISSASAGTASRGGTNPSSVGYGSKLAAVQTKMTQSSMQSTGYGLDVAITGEGFFQVMDPDGNIFYTKSGMLDYDSNGYLTDINGNFVLGSTSADGTPDSKKIKLDNIGAVAAKQSSAEVTINGIKYTMTASNSTEKGNVGISIGASSDLPGGQSAKASISTTGAITVQLSTNAKFVDLAAVNSAINTAIKEANGGKDLAAGTFTLASAAADAKIKAVAGGLTGAEICGSSFSKLDGTITDAGTSVKFFNNSMSLVGTSKDFTGSGTVASGAFTATYNAGPPKNYIISMTVGTDTYKGIIEEGATYSTVLLKNQTAGKSDSIEVTNPGYSVIDALTPPRNAYATDLTVNPAKESNDMGLSSATFNLEGGTAGGPVTLDQLTSIAIGSDGTISVSHPDKGTVAAGKVSLANFSNPAGLELEGSNYFSATANSGKAILCDPGSSGTGSLVSSSLEMSNVDLSSEFADMITTQRGFQANSRIITVSDAMLEELINLKR